MALEEIKEQVKSVIQYSQGIEDPKVDKLIDDWYKAKEDFIKQLDEFRLEYGVGRDKLIEIYTFFKFIYNIYILIDKTNIIICC